MVYDIENKTRRELVEILEVAQQEYRDLLQKHEELDNQLHWERVHRSMAGNEEVTKIVSRLEVIDDTGRTFIKYLKDYETVRLAYQDGGRTLKVFIERTPEYDTNEYYDEECVTTTEGKLWMKVEPTGSGAKVNSTKLCSVSIHRNGPLFVTIEDDNND